MIQVLERHLALFSRSNDDELKNLTFKPDMKITRPLVRELSDAIDRTIIIHQGEFDPRARVPPEYAHVRKGNPKRAIRLVADGDPYNGATFRAAIFRANPKERRPEVDSKAPKPDVTQTKEVIPHQDAGSGIEIEPEAPSNPPGPSSKPAKKEVPTAEFFFCGCKHDVYKDFASLKTHFYKHGNDKVKCISPDGSSHDSHGIRLVSVKPEWLV